jgi:hypothetical protein
MSYGRSKLYLRVRILPHRQDYFGLPALNPYGLILRISCGSLQAILFEPATLGLRQPMLYPNELRAQKSKSLLVGVEGFEPPTHCSQSSCATRLRYTPIRRRFGKARNNTQIGQ